MAESCDCNRMLSTASTSCVSDLIKTFAIDFDFEKLLIFFNSFDFDIGFDVQKWPIQLLILILTFNSDHPTIDFDVQKWSSNYWFWFWCSKVIIQLLILILMFKSVPLLILIFKSGPSNYWYWTINPTIDHVCCY